MISNIVNNLSYAFGRVADLVSQFIGGQGEGLFGALDELSSKVF